MPCMSKVPVHGAGSESSTQQGKASCETIQRDGMKGRGGRDRNAQKKKNRAGHLVVKIQHGFGEFLVKAQLGANVGLYCCQAQQAH